MRGVTCAGTVGLALFAWTCGDGFGPAPRDPQDLRIRFEIESAPEGFGQAVSVDSASWFPAAQLLTGNAEDVEVEGPYRIAFRSLSARSLQMRYDLRFLDEDGFLVDRFIPFGQPVLLPPGQTRVEEGTFLVRTVPAVGRFGLATMHIAARLTLQE